MKLGAGVPGVRYFDCHVDASNIGTKQPSYLDVKLRRALQLERFVTAERLDEVR